MLKKNIEKQKRKVRKTWVGLFIRKTPTKRQLIEKQLKREKQNYQKDNK